MGLGLLGHVVRVGGSEFLEYAGQREGGCIAPLQRGLVAALMKDRDRRTRGRERLEELAQTINMVAGVFAGDVNKTVAWFKARNPLLGDVSPRDMIRLGRYEKLRKFIINAMLESRGAARPTSPAH